MFEGKGEDDERGRNISVCVVVWGKVRGSVCTEKVCVCVSESESVCVHQHKPVCSTENRTRQQIPAASVADKLQGLAGTSGAQVALSIQDRAH